MEAPGRARRYNGLVAAVVVLAGGVLVYRRAQPPPPSLPAEPARPTSPAPVSTAPKPAPPKAPAKSEGLAFDLVEASRETGVVFTHEKFVPGPLVTNVEPWLASAGVGVAVADVDGDDRPDIYVTTNRQGAANALFLNKGDGTFREAAAAAGLADVNGRLGSMRPLFFDIDNDGDKDLVLTTHYCVQVFKNDGKGVFAHVPGDAGIDHCGITFASNAVDLDADGDLDFIAAGYYPPFDLHELKSSVVMQNSFTDADNGGETRVYRNDGAGNFSRWPGNLGIAGRVWTLAVAGYDFQDDGNPDLYFATDFNADRLLLNRGQGRFEDASDAVTVKYSRNGMNADVAEVTDGRPAVFVTHIFEPPHKLGPNTLWTWIGGERRFEDRGKASGAGACGWAWGGRFVDLDLDGWQDLVVTNGYISANPDKSYWYSLSVLAGSTRDVMADAKNWPPMGDYSMSGYQRKCVFRNEKGTFRQVVHETGMKDDLSDGRAVAVIDARGDGAQDLVMANQGQPLRYYRNVAKRKSAWIGFKLVGTRSNRDAWGARVRLRAGGRVLTRQLAPANSFMSQADDRLVFGLGATAGEPEVEVRWPSGTVQKLGKMAPGKYHRLVEPATP
ncbi:MAG: CRTAC1 family protein [Elusimicrobia bacterium]|nr:CRTAC1 family protein [Elusimicrobiota bacterium]